MATSNNSKAVGLNAGTLNFSAAGTYDFKLLPNGNVQVKLSNGQTTVLSDKEFDSILTLNLGTGVTLNIDANLLAAEQFQVTGGGNLNVTGHVTGVTFIQASANLDSTGKGNFETSINLDTIIKDALTDHPHDMALVLSQLSINGNVADSVKAVWDYLDDHYSDYYGNVNEDFIRLGVEYAKYVKAGGAPLTDVIAKFNADANHNGTPDRLQSMHDNLMGNFNATDFNSRFPPGSDLNNTLVSLMNTVGWGDLTQRGAYSGNESAVSGHDAARVWDYAHGIARPDQVEHSFGNLAPANHDGNNNVFFGAGNSAADYVIGEHVGAGIELGLKVHYRTGDTVGPTSTDADGTAHFTIDSGAQDGRHNENGPNANRAAWSFDFSEAAGLNGANTDLNSFNFKILVDLDPTSGVKYVDLSATDPISAHTINEHLAQDSFNYGFIRQLIDVNPNMDGVQPYDFRAGQFDIVVQADDKQGHVLASTHIVVDVTDGWMMHS